MAPKSRKANTYTIRNCNGISGGAWSKTYTSLESARRALKAAMGWRRITLSQAYPTGDGYTEFSRSAYGSVADQKRDIDGVAHAPTIVTHTHF